MPAQFVVRLTPSFRRDLERLPSQDHQKILDETLLVLVLIVNYQKPTADLNLMGDLSAVLGTGRLVRTSDPTPNEKKTGERYQSSPIARVEEKKGTRKVPTGKSVPLATCRLMGDPIGCYAAEEIPFEGETGV